MFFLRIELQGQILGSNAKIVLSFFYLQVILYT